MMRTKAISATIGCIGGVIATALAHMALENLPAVSHDLGEDLAADTTSADLSGVDVYTNLPTYEYRIEEPERVSQYSGPIIYKTHVAYSPYFAEQYGFPADFITQDLPDFVDYMAFEVKHAGPFSHCNIKLLIDRDGPVRLPPFDTYQPFGGGNVGMLRSALPKRIPSAKEKLYQAEYRNQQSEYDGSVELRRAVHNSFFLFGLKDKEDLRGVGGGYSLSIEAFKQRQLSEWVYFELANSCGSMFNKTISQNWVALLATPKGAPPNFMPARNNLEVAVRIEIPEAIKNAVAADLSKINFK